MKAIFKRELKAYFASPVGYVVVAALVALYAFFFYQVMTMGSSSYIGEVFNTMFMFSMMIMPIMCRPAEEISKRDFFMVRGSFLVKKCIRFSIVTHEKENYNKKAAATAVFCRIFALFSWCILQKGGWRCIIR